MHFYKMNCQAALAAHDRFDLPRFLALGYYVDLAFVCRDCGAAEVWRAAQQKWWYEVAKGHLYSTAIRCRKCRARVRSGVGGGPERAAR